MHCLISFQIFIRTEPGVNIKADNGDYIEKIDGVIDTIIFLEMGMIYDNYINKSVYDDISLL